MNERIREFLQAENKSSAQFAEEIGVQPSGISHILSGRNNPSLDFVLKMLDKYKNLSTDWLLFGNGQMYKTGSADTLFSDSTAIEPIKRKDEYENPKDPIGRQTEHNEEINNFTAVPNMPGSGRNSVVKIVWFYDNNSFEEYFPRK